MPTAVFGSVTAAPGMLFSYDLSYAKDSDGVYVSISSGTEPYAGFLGVLDPTLLENGIYHVRLMATDINGTVTSTTVNVQVRGLAKIGVLTLTFTDLRVPVAGIPISVTRQYDSRVTAQRDFGVSWNLTLTAGSLEINQPLATGWLIPAQAPIGYSGLFIRVQPLPDPRNSRADCAESCRQNADLEAISFV